MATQYLVLKLPNIDNMTLRKIGLIRSLRSVINIGLKEAKDITEDFINGYINEYKVNLNDVRVEMSMIQIEDELNEWFNYVRIENEPLFPDHEDKQVDVEDLNMGIAEDLHDTMLRAAQLAIFDKKIDLSIEILKLFKEHINNPEVNKEFS